MDDERAGACFMTASKGLDEPASAMFYNDQPPETIFYQGLAWLKLKNAEEGKQKLHKLIDYAQEHLSDAVKIDYFAVSLPDFAVFEDDLIKRNEIHCHYMMGLGFLGLKRYADTVRELEQVLRMDVCHVGAIVHLKMCTKRSVLNNDQSSHYQKVEW